jgi:hypothetical protein
MASIIELVQLKLTPLRSKLVCSFLHGLGAVANVIKLFRAVSYEFL